jgi:hypothetical protein
VGAWGPGPFENDDAGDWVWELEDDDDGSVIIDALSAVVDTPIDEQPDVADSSNALAAAEVVASARGARSTHLPTEASVWIQAHASLVDNGLLALATGAVERIAIDSELKDLWDETRDDAWAESVSDILSRLRAGR